MRRLQLVGIGVFLWATSTASAQAPPGDLTQELRARVQEGRFDDVSSIRGLPLGVRAELQRLFGGTTLEISESNGASPGTGDIPVARLPRRLVAAGCSHHDCLVYYELGAPAVRMRRVLLFHWTPDATTFEWGGTAPAGLNTIDAVRRAVLSGAIKTSSGPW
jgi:hypothetical protein